MLQRQFRRRQRPARCGPGHDLPGRARQQRPGGPPQPAAIDEGRSANVPAPQIAKDYWGLPDQATLRDVVLVVRADEAHHRDVNHGFANELAGLPVGAVAVSEE